MKKLLSIIACIAVISALALTSCGESNDDTSSSVSSAISSANGADESSVTANSSSSSGMTIEEYIEKDRDSLNEMSASYEALGLKTNIYAKGNSLVYSFQYTTDVGSSDLLKDSLNSSLESLTSTYESLLSLMKIEVPTAESITVEYLDMDGNVIASKEYK